MTQNFKIMMPKIFRISVFFNSCAFLVMPNSFEIFMADCICFVAEKCITIGKITENSSRNCKIFEISYSITCIHHITETLVNLTIMSWLISTVDQFVVGIFFHKRNNLTNRFCSGFKLSDSVSMMMFCYSLTLGTKFEFWWQNCHLY